MLNLKQGSFVAIQQQQADSSDSRITRPELDKQRLTVTTSSRNPRGAGRGTRAIINQPALPQSSPSTLLSHAATICLMHYQKFVKSNYAADTFAL